MKVRALLTFTAFFAAGLSSCAIAASEDGGGLHQIVLSAETFSSSAASSRHFTGYARVDTAFSTESPQKVYGAYVTFEPGARTHWHIHPMGQTLIVTSGIGLTQEWNGPLKVIRPGDVVLCPPGVKHWHGASAHSAMTHLAIGEKVPGKGGKWEEPVSEEQYAGK